MKQFLLEIAKSKTQFLPLLRGDLRGVVILLLRPFLYLLSLIYGFLVFITRGSHYWGILPRYKSKLKVISIGNVTVGGTGKTPLVEFLAGYFIRNSKRPIIVSRGYSLDEPRLLANNLPQAVFFTGKNRVASIKKIESDNNFKNSSVIILDDGFQHWKIQRDLDIITVDAQNPFGNKQLIPAGTLRESLSAIGRAGIIMLTKVDLAENLEEIKSICRKIAPRALMVEAVYAPKYIYGESLSPVDTGSLSSSRVLLLSSIAQPESFRKTVTLMGLNFVFSLDYPDHYQYKQTDIVKIINTAKENKADTILTTEKDLSRLSWKSFPGLRILILKAELKIIKNEKEFFSRIHNILAG